MFFRGSLCHRALSGLIQPVPNLFKDIEVALDVLQRAIFGQVMQKRFDLLLTLLMAFSTEQDRTQAKAARLTFDSPI